VTSTSAYFWGINFIDLGPTVGDSVETVPE